MMEQLIYYEIWQLRKTCFEIFRTDISFVRRESKSKSKSKRRTFAFTLGHDTLKAVRIQHDQHGRILVQFGHKKWCTLGQFLTTNAPASTTTTASDGQPMLSHFWNHTGQRFRLLDLPAEIRNSVYRHALFPTETERPYRLRPRIGLHSFTRHSRRPSMEPDFAPNLALLRVSRRVGAESVHLLYTHAEFHFSRPEDCNAFFMGIGVESARLVRRLDLCFSHMGFLRFFGAKVGDGMVFVNAPALEVIRAKIGMGHFEWVALHMPRPAGVADRRELCDAEFPCPKRVVDWILASAFPWLEELDPARLYLGGCVKEGQHRRFAGMMRTNFVWRRWWEAYCAATDREDGGDEVDGGVSLRGCDTTRGHMYGANDGVRESADDKIGLPERGEVWVDGPVPALCECETTCSLTDFDRKD